MQTKFASKFRAEREAFRLEPWKLNKAKSKCNEENKYSNYENEKFSGKKYYNKSSNEKSSIIRDQDGQANKSAGRMPWHWEPKKDVVSCEKLRGMASTYWSADIRMEQSDKSYVLSSYTE